MSHVPPDEPNPYACPVIISTSSTVETNDAAVITLVKDFRAQSFVLGIVWSLFGGIAVGAALLLFAIQDMRELNIPHDAIPVLCGILVFFGLLWSIAGWGTLLKQRWALWYGLIFCYFVGLGNLTRFNLCGVIIALAMILQAHRVIRLANIMRMRGIPLNHRP